MVTFVVGHGNRRKGTVQLNASDWDDWYEFCTLYNASYLDATGVLHNIGLVKIGEIGLEGQNKADYRGERGFRSPTLERRFTDIGQTHFSLGQDTSYYEKLTGIGETFRDEYLRAMNDIAADRTLLTRVQTENVTRVSLLRSVPLQTVKQQFGRLVVGQPALTEFRLEFPLEGEGLERDILTFDVTPHSRPPTNIHVLIGRNGVGKSRTLNRIATAIVDGSREVDAFETEAPQWKQLSNVVSVSFSAFDSFTPIPEPRDRTLGLTYHYVGLRKKSRKASAPLTPESPLSETKDLASLSREMTQSAKTCLLGARRARWIKALTLLGADPIFGALGLIELIEDQVDEDVLGELPNIFRYLSSGHKIVLLTITKLVETVEEKSLVLLDEPESHLHPPLLSAFVRALSDLLVDRNGLAIVATHSPVVLQEVPGSCVWRLRRSGNDTSAERLAIETFGENVGILTNEVFGLEVIATGFHTLLGEIASDTDDYRHAVSMLDGQLGSEGRAILRAMINVRIHSRSVGH